MYLGVSLLPLTLFYLAAIVLRFRATLPLMIGSIFYSQISSPLLLRWYGYTSSIQHYSHEPVRAVMDICITYLSIWNLDFFRMVYSPLCLHPNASTL